MNKINNNINTKILIGITANIFFTFFEFAMGLMTNSLALISDGALNLADVLSLCISFSAQKIATTKPTSQKTFGYGRATIAAAFINGCFLLGFAIYIFSQAYERLYTPEVVEGGVVMLVGFFGIIVNGGAASLLHASTGDLNIKSAYLNMVFDALASAAALFSGFIIYFTGYTIIDPIISTFIGILLLISAYNILSETIHLFFEGVPKNINKTTIESILLNDPAVQHIIGLHIWALSTKTAALNAQLAIANNSLAEDPHITRRIKSNLKKHTDLENKLEHIVLELVPQ